MTRDMLGSPSPDALAFGRLVQDGKIGAAMRYGGELHSLVFGPNGSGKTTRLLLSNLLRMQDRSIVVVDPKGELAAVSAPYRRTIGDVVILNPFNLLCGTPGYEDIKSDGYNPLLFLDPSLPSFNVEAALLAEALVKVEGKDPHWDQSAQGLIAGLIMYVCAKARDERRNPTLAEVRRYLCEEAETPDKKRDRPGKGIPAIAHDLLGSPNPAMRNKLSQFAYWTDETQSIASAAKRQTEALDDFEIAADLAKGTFDFRELKKKPTTVYLILPPEMLDRHSKWLRLILTSALRSVMRPREQGEPRVLFMIDEFAALGHLQIIETVWALVRGYGIQIMPVLQDLHQLKGLYTERWESFIGMAGVVAAFGAREMTTAKWMSERSGERTERLYGYNTGIGESTGSSSTNKGLSLQLVKLPYLSPQHFLQTGNGYLNLWLAGVSETVSAFAPSYWQYTALKDRARWNPYIARETQPEK